MPDPKNITEETTLGELREQRLLLGVNALFVYPSMSCGPEGCRSMADEHTVAANVHHATGVYVGMGPTEATAIEAAFVKLRQDLLPAPLKQYLQEIDQD